MKKLFAVCTMLLAGTMLSTAQDAKKEAPKSPRANSKSEIAEVSYGQPSKRGREIFGKLVPYGEIWRTGANMSTDVTFHQDVNFGGKSVKKGTYSIFTIPEKKEWTVILNSVPGQRGASEYDKNKGSNVVEVKAKVQHLMPAQEAFTIDFEGSDMVFKWDMVKVAVPVTKK